MIKSIYKKIFFCIASIYLLFIILFNGMNNKNILKVSIITISYNEVDHIEQTLLSVLNQDYDNIEYIVIDGGSTDGTVDIINKYKDRIAYFVSEKDKGIYNAMNKGLKHATGDVVGIINAGDWYAADNVVSEAVGILSKNQIDIVCAGHNVVKDDVFNTVMLKKSFSDMHCGMIAAHESHFIRKDIYDKFGFYDESFKIAADYELLLRMYTSGAKFYAVNSVWVNFRAGGISSTNHILCAEESNYVMAKYIDKAPDKNLVEKKMQERLINAKFQTLYKEAPDTVLYILTQHSFCNAEKIVVWGCGVWGQKIYDLFNNFGLHIDYFIDSNENNHGKLFNNIKIKSPSFLKEYKGVLFVAIINHDEELHNTIEVFNSSLLSNTYFVSELKKDAAKLYDESDRG